MADEDELKEFPDVSQKLAAPKKLSAYEKEKQAAEAKRQREEAENAAALREFEESFAGESEDELEQFATRGRNALGPNRALSGSHSKFDAGSRHRLPQNGQRSGPGGLGPVAGQQPPSLKRKRALDEMREAQKARREEQSFGNHEGSHRDQIAEKHESEDEQEELPKPVVHLLKLPPSITVEEIKTILNPHMKVHSVRTASTSGHGQTGKKSLSATVTLKADLTSSQIDSAMNALQDKYLSCGYTLSITRNVSSTGLHPGISGSRQDSSATPFNAQQSKPHSHQASQRQAPPIRDHRGYAPPDSYDGRSFQNRKSQDEVDARPPVEIATLRAIHTIADRLLSESSPEHALEVEALLMSLPEVQNDERFAFLFDSQSPAGIYYRHCLWRDEPLVEATKQNETKERLHRDIDIMWHHSPQEMPFPTLTQLSSVVTDIDYVSSDEELDEEDIQLRNNGADHPDKVSKDKRFLSPLQRARLAHLLARLPSVNTRLRTGDVARVTSFAINHAGNGIEQIVDMLLLNIERPFCTTLAAKYEDDEAYGEKMDDSDEDDEYDPEQPLPDVDLGQDTGKPDHKPEDREDPANAKLVALYIISDVLSASSLAGARNAWKYRQLFESGFREQETFKRLGALDRELGWGKIKAEQWKRKLAALFEIWEGWSAFPADALSEMKRAFYNEPEVPEDNAATRDISDQQRDKVPKWLSRFKKVESAPQARPQEDTPVAKSTPDEKQNKSQAVDGKALNVIDDSEKPRPSQEVVQQMTAPSQDIVPSTQPDPTNQSSFEQDTSSKTANGAPKKRMRAEDMFADSDED